MIQEEFEISVVDEDILLVHEISDQGEVIGCSSPGVLARNSDLCVGQHQDLDEERLRANWVVVVLFVDLGRLHQITLTDVPQNLIVRELLPVVMLTLLRTYPVEVTAEKRMLLFACRRSLLMDVHRKRLLASLPVM